VALPLPSAPEEILLQQTNAPARVPYDYCNADEKLRPDQKLPDSNLLKDIHKYVSRFHDTSTTSEPENHMTPDPWRKQSY